MSDALPPDACWTSLRGAPVHRLGEMPVECYTCAAHARAEPKPPARPTRASKHPYMDTGAQRECVRVFRCMTCGDESIGLDKAEAHARAHDAEGALAGTRATKEQEQELRPIQHRVGGLAHVGFGCWCRMGEACPETLRQQSEDIRRNAKARERRDTEALKRDLAAERRGHIDEWLAEDEWARAKLANWSRRRVDSLRQGAAAPDQSGYYSRDAARRREQDECDARTGRKSGPATLGDTRLVGGMHCLACAPVKPSEEA